VLADSDDDEYLVDNNNNDDNVPSTPNNSNVLAVSTDFSTMVACITRCILLIFRAHNVHCAYSA